MRINLNFIDGARCEITDDTREKRTFQVEFINKRTGRTETVITINNNCWAKATKRFYIDWKIKVRGVDHNFYYEYDFDCTGKRILISLDSNLIGDTFAWLDYIEQFRAEKQCHVICSGFHNQLFKDQYPDIEFVEPGVYVEDLYAAYIIGIYIDNNTWDIFKNPINPFDQPLQKIASDMLGLSYKESRPRLALSANPTPKKRACIAIHGSMQCKYWNNPTGWQEVVDHLLESGYEVVLLSREDDGFRGVPHPKGVVRHPSGAIEDVIRVLEESQFFVGLSSGLSWVSWAVGIPTILISGFTDTYVEPIEGIYRLINTDVCHGCWGRHTLQRDNHFWCPEHQDTPRHFECTKEISASTVIHTIEAVRKLRPYPADPTYLPGEH